MFLTQNSFWCHLSFYLSLSYLQIHYNASFNFFSVEISMCILWDNLSLRQFWKIINYHLFKYCLSFFYFLEFPLYTYWMLFCLHIYHFYLCDALWVIPTVLYSKSLILSLVMSNILYIFVLEFFNFTYFTNIPNISH